MKFKINIDQQAIMDSGLDLDLVDGAILDFCTRFSETCDTKVVDGVCYYWFSHKNICSQMPLLRMKPDSIYRRMVKLCEKVVLLAHPENKQLNQSWYAFGINYNKLVSTIGSPSDGTPGTPPTIGFQSEPSDLNPMPHRTVIRCII